MTRAAIPLLTRLRRHRGLWLLAVAVLLFKLVSGSICVADGAAAQSALAATDAVPVAVWVAASGDDADAANTCLMGEGSACHCACAHTAPLPAGALLALTGMDAPLAPSMRHSGFTPAISGSLLRPPIA